MRNSFVTKYKQNEKSPMFKNIHISHEKIYFLKLYGCLLLLTLFEVSLIHFHHFLFQRNIVKYKLNEKSPMFKFIYTLLLNSQ